MLASANKNESESLNKLLSGVIEARQEMKADYVRKLNKYYVDRAIQMKDGIFDGNTLPEIRYDKHALNECIQKNHKLVEKAQSNMEQYSFAKAKHQQTNDELKEMAESLQKVIEIENAIRADESHTSHEPFPMNSP